MSPGPMTMPGRLASWSGLLPASYRSWPAARCAPAKREPNPSWCRLKTHQAGHEKEWSMIVGNGDFRYRVNADWAKLPEGWSFKEVGGIGVDSHDNVYVFNRGVHPMQVFDREGHSLRSGGEGGSPRAHGVHMAPDDTMFLTDDGGHFARKVTLDGKVLLELGVPGSPAPFMSGEPFHRCTHTALSPKGEIYVSDGYGTSRG